MPHIHTQPGDHDHTASAYLIRVDYSEPKIVLHLHKKIHKYMQFGGHIETHENPWQAIVHELREEAGYDMAKLRVLQPKTRIRSIEKGRLHPVPVYHVTYLQNDPNINGDHFHTDIAYAIVANSDPTHELAKGESSKLIELTRSELSTMNNEDIYDSVRDTGLFIFDQCLPEWEEVDPAIFD